MAKVVFKKGTYDQYKKVATKDSSTLYYITGTSGSSTGSLYQTGVGMCFLGDTLISNNVVAGSYDGSTKTLVLTNIDRSVINIAFGSTDIQNKDEVQKLIDDSVASAVRIKGSSTVTGLPTTGLKNGDMYNLTDSGSVYGKGGETLNVVTGDNIVWIVDSTGSSYWDKFAGSFTLPGSLIYGAASGSTGQIAIYSGDYTIVGSSVSGVIGSTVQAIIDEWATGSLINGTKTLDTGSTTTVPSQYTVAQYVGSVLTGYIPTATATNSHLAMFTGGGTGVADAGMLLSTGGTGTGDIASGNTNIVLNAAQVFYGLQDASVQWSELS